MLHCVGIAFIVADLTCAPVGQIAQSRAAFCDVVTTPLRVSRKDTPRTILRANRRLAQWKALCGEGAR